MDSSASSALQGCVSSLRTSMQLLESSINILDTGVNDYPRLTKVLQTTRVRLNQSSYLNQNFELTISTALRARLRTLPPNRSTNPPLLPRTRTQRPPLPRRSAPRQNGAPRTVTPGQSGTARRPTLESQPRRQAKLDVETECDRRGYFFGRWRFEQFGAVEDQPVETEEGKTELCCWKAGVAGRAEGEAVEEEHGVSVRMLLICDGRGNGRFVIL